jgi:prepilin-type N-terminal cleavage/methylation domain-containing protein
MAISNKGFSLLEVITVLAIISISAVALLPYSRSLLEEIRLNTTTTAIKHQLIIAKTRALDDSKIHCGVFIDTVHNLVQTYLDDGTPGGNDKYDRGSDHIFMKAYNVPSSITLHINSGNFSTGVIFRGDGSAKIPGLTLTITNKNKKSKHISVIPSTGRIKLY